MDWLSPGGGPDECGFEVSMHEGITTWLRRVRRRVLADRFLRALILDLGVSLSVLALGLLVERTVLPGLVSPHLAVALLLVSFLVSASRTFLLTPLDLFSVAVLADGRLGLKERVSTSLYLWRSPPAEDSAVEEGRRELGRLVSSDAWRHLRARSVADGFPVGLPRRSALVSVPLLACVGLALWLPSFDLLGLDARREGREQMAKAVAEEKKHLEEDLAKLEREAKEIDARQIEKLLQSIRRRETPEQKPGEEAGQGKLPPEGGSEPKKEALLELTHMEDLLKEGLRGADFDRLRKTLEDSKALDLKDSEATRALREGLKDGNLAKAKEGLQKIADELSRLARPGEADRTSAQRPELEKLRQELQRLARELKSNPALSKALSKAAASLPSLAELPKDALEGIRDALEELHSLEMLANDRELLAEALDAMRFSKDRLAALKGCPRCGSPRCPDCGKPRCVCAPGMKPGGT